MFIILEILVTTKHSQSFWMIYESIMSAWRILRSVKFMEVDLGINIIRSGLRKIQVWILIQGFFRHVLVRMVVHKPFPVWQLMIGT